MRVIADENVHFVVVARLRAASISVEWIAESSSGIADADLLALGDAGDVVLVTYDSDFGRMIFAEGKRPPRNIIYSRLGRAEPNYIADRILTLLGQPLPPHHMITIARDRDRLTPFPDGASNG